MINRQIVGSRMSKIVEHNGVIYFAGIVPTDKTVDVKGQTLEVLNIAKDLFEQANTDNENILRAEIYLKNIMKSGMHGYQKKILLHELA